MPPSDKQNPTCAWVATHVDEYLDGLLDEVDARRLRTHCTECPECAYELELATAVRDGLDALTLIPCPDEVTDRVFEEITASSSRRRPSAPVWLTLVKPIWRPVSVAAAAAAVVIMMFVSIRHDSQPTQAEVDRALSEAKFALAVISDVGRVTGRQVGAEVKAAVVEPVRSVLDEDEDVENGL